jgi:hypothetical protein
MRHPLLSIVQRKGPRNASRVRFPRNEPRAFRSGQSPRRYDRGRPRHGLDKGIVKIEEVELDDGIWEVEGTDASGREIEMKVEALSGQIIKVERN